MTKQSRKSHAAQRMTWSPSDLKIVKSGKEDDQRRQNIYEAVKRLKGR